MMNRCKCDWLLHNCGTTAPSTFVLISQCAASERASVKCSLDHGENTQIQRFDRLRFQMERAVLSATHVLVSSRDHHFRKDVGVCTFNIFFQSLLATVGSVLQWSLSHASGSVQQVPSDALQSCEVCTCLLSRLHGCTPCRRVYVMLDRSHARVYQSCGHAVKKELAAQKVPVLPCSSGAFNSLFEFDSIRDFVEDRSTSAPKYDDVASLTHLAD